MTGIHRQRVLAGLRRIHYFLDPGPFVEGPCAPLNFCLEYKINRALDQNVASEQLLHYFKEHPRESIGTDTLNRVLELLPPRLYREFFERLLVSGHVFSAGSRAKRLLTRLCSGTLAERATFLLKTRQYPQNPFLSQYSDDMRVTTIKRLNEKTYTHEALLFLRLYKSTLTPESKRWPQYYRLWNDLLLRHGRHPVLNLETVHASIDLILRHYFVVERDLEKGLKIMNRYFEATDTKLSPNRIDDINLAFLKCLSATPAATPQIVVSYVLTMYPKSYRVLEQVGLLSMIYENRCGTVFKRPELLLKPNIREELVCGDRMPPLDVLATVYRSLLFSTRPSKLQTKVLFAHYLDFLDTSLPSSTVVLDMFLSYIDRVHHRPIFAARLLESFLDKGGFSKAAKIHSTNVNAILSRLASHDVSRAIELANKLKNIVSLDARVFYSFVCNLDRIGETDAARVFYNKLLDHQASVAPNHAIMNFSKLGHLCYKNKWPVPQLTRDPVPKRRSTEIANTKKLCYAEIVEFLDAMRASP
ncbi:uncharacterized protein OGAPODRAFT_95853 [Ogataea polymorpha]|nr:uncharacterized protein OGAPODRAFT_95853 [Ogataea polymorpha]KAG7915486.1 hypothetical protein KL927_003762 [Ogataea polymorpha]KAG7932947.1 hypothetical protein KL934_003602 [Ogataea polymorpha]OBA13704.1 hypothetical protein OGAPODRAFT_95853 [Ogataea polymorpha]